MKRKTKIISRLIKQNIIKTDGNAEVILYGSRARGDERAGSDWDILVLTDYSVDISKERSFRDNLYELELEVGESFSLFVYSKNEWMTKQKVTPFYQNVMREGIRL